MSRAQQLVAHLMTLTLGVRREQRQELSYKSNIAQLIDQLIMD
jgi:hypothetical protein